MWKTSNSHLAMHAIIVLVNVINFQSFLKILRITFTTLLNPTIMDSHNMHYNLSKNNTVFLPEDGNSNDLLGEIASTHVKP